MITNDIIRGIMLATVCIAVAFLIGATSYSNGQRNIYQSIENYGCEKMMKLHNNKKG